MFSAPLHPASIALFASFQSSLLQGSSMHMSCSFTRAPGAAMDQEKVNIDDMLLFYFFSEKWSQS